MNQPVYTCLIRFWFRSEYKFQTYPLQKANARYFVFKKGKFGTVLQLPSFLKVILKNLVFLIEKLLD